MLQGITEKTYTNLCHDIYITLINLPYIDEEGEIQERGMGEMGETEEESERIVDEWMKKNNVMLIN